MALVILISVLTTSGYAVSALTTNTKSAESVASISTSNQVLNRVIVESGMSLWTIASEYKPAHVSTRAYVKYLMKINELNTPTIQLGDVILVP
jgi:LysM repeat protein